jgi:hypothetical protein
MRFLVLYLTLISVVIVESHEFNGFSLKFLYQVFTGDFINMKKKDNKDQKVLRNETSNYLG